MLIPVNDFSAIITEWVDKTIIPVTKDSILRSLMRGVLAVNGMVISDVINNNKGILEKLNYMKEGLVDTEAVCKHLKASLPEGESIEFNLKDIVPLVFGTTLESAPVNALLDRPYRLDSSDIHALLQAIETYNNSKQG